MKKLILLPKFFLSRHTDNYKFLFARMADELNFDYRYSDHPNLHDYDIIIAYAIPHHSFPDYSLAPFLDLPSSTKLIVFTRDDWCFENTLCRQRRDLMFHRADMVWTPNFSLCSELYPQYANKIYFFPFFYADDARYHWDSPKLNPLKKFILSGAVSKHYKFREHIASAKHPQIDVRHSQFMVGDAYANMLREYYGAVSSSIIYEQVHAKVFETLAAGLLLLIDQTFDMDILGFVPNEHYIAVEKEDVLQSVDACLSNPDYFYEVRRCGMQFVKENHSLSRRLELVKFLLEEL